MGKKVEHLFVLAYPVSLSDFLERTNIGALIHLWCCITPTTSRRAAEDLHHFGAACAEARLAGTAAEIGRAHV